MFFGMFQEQLSHQTFNDKNIQTSYYENGICLSLNFRALHCTKFVCSYCHVHSTCFESTNTRRL